MTAKCNWCGNPPAMHAKTCPFNKSDDVSPEEYRKRRINQIGFQIINSMIERGEVNENDEAAMKKAAKAAWDTARAAYNAAEEYVCG